MADDIDDLLELGRGRRAAGIPHAPGPAGSDFPALQIIVVTHKVIAAIAFVLGVIGVLVVLAAPHTNGLAVLVAVAWTLLVPLFLWGSGEFILVFLRIEQNTRRASELLSGPERRSGYAEPGAAPDRRGM